MTRVSDDFYKAFSSRARLELISCLANCSKCQNVNCLIKSCNLSQSAVSQHLKKLTDWGLIEYRDEGRDRFYQLSDPKIAKIARQILSLKGEK